MATVETIQFETYPLRFCDNPRLTNEDIHVAALNKQLVELLNNGWRYDGMCLVEDVLCFSKNGHPRTVPIPIDYELIITFKSR